MFSTRFSMFPVCFLVLCIVNGNYNQEKSALNDEFNRTEKYHIFNVNTKSLLSDSIIEFEAFNQYYKIKLTANQNFQIDTNQTKKKLDPETYKSCYYFGTVLNCDNRSSVAVSMCDGRGITGIISAFGETLMIEPYGANGQHAVLKLSQPSTGQQKTDKVETTPFNNVDTKRGKRRRLAYNNGDNVVEIYILSDPSKTEHFQDLSLNWYNEMVQRLSQIVNGGNAEYVNQFWGDQVGQVSLKWVELEIVESFDGIYAALEPPLLYNGEVDGSAYIRLFRQWVLDNKNQNDFDAAILFTKLDMDSSAIAFKEAMCSSDGWAVSVITDRGNLAREIKLIAHEIGHNFGMQHDEPQYNNCPDGNIMGDGDYNTGWSSCSVQYINRWFANNNGLSCLANRNQPFKTNYNGATEPTPTPQPITAITAPNQAPPPWSAASSHNAICQGSGDCGCPSDTTGICEINCVGIDGCKDGVISCNNDGYECIVNCVGNGGCGGSASIIGPNGAQLIVNCIGPNSCEGSMAVHGETGTNLYVQCDGDTTCKAAHFYFGAGEGITACYGEHDSCQDAVFNFPDNAQSIPGFTFDCIGHFCPGTSI